MEQFSNSNSNSNSNSDANNKLGAFGWTPEWAEAFGSLCVGSELVPGRVAEEQRGVLRVLWSGGELMADVSGRLRYLVAGPAELPGVGDWVSVSPRPEEGAGTIHHVLPRRTALVRKAPERPAEGQLLAANVDTVFVVTSANRELRPRRIERTLALVREGGAGAVVVLSKSDLAGDLSEVLARVEPAAAGHPVHALCALDGQGVSQLEPFLGPGATVALLGSSGVGKTTLANRLLGRDAGLGAGAEPLPTSEIRAADDKGRHTTTHRELLPLPGGAVLIDTPGLREVGLWDDSGGVDSAFPDVEGLFGLCRFGDCRHREEPGCAIHEALSEGRLDPARWESYGKLKREAEKLAARRTQRGRREQRKKAKRFAKAIRNRPDKRDPRRRGV